MVRGGRGVFKSKTEKTAAIAGKSNKEIIVRERKFMG